MKTLIIFTEYPDKVPLFAILDGDHSKFNGVVINAGQHELESEFYEFMYNSEGELRYSFKNDVAIIETKEWNKVAVTGFIC